MFGATVVALLLSLFLALFLALRGATLFDRALAANFIGTVMLLLLIMFGFLTGRPDFLDVGLTFALLNAISVLAILKFWRYGDLGHAGEEPED